ncbi:MAG: SUF system NifU family Fe-S cluster assembly protein [Candidatus Thermoplasmatota archaeon]|nr:SUF system NifU family Fe-S cluster assembly protein [Candidatus Thermoplasmatota archaeon]
MTQASDLYQEVILDHTKKPRNFGRLEPCDHHARGDNPVCGDQLEVFVDLDEEGIIRDIKFEGQGCAISQASASVMTGEVKGRPAQEARDLSQQFRDLITGRTENVEGIGKLEVFTGVKRFPTRVKCATLAWHTLTAALHGEETVVTTEE